MNETLLEATPQKNPAAENGSTERAAAELSKDIWSGADLELAAGRAAHRNQGAASHLVRTTAHPGEKTVALTFDDGPSAKFTPQVLSLLKENNIKATFCLVGVQVKQYPQLAKEIASEGHKLCDHSMTHDEQLPRKSDERIKQEILGDKELIQKVVPNADVPYYRAPGGNFAGHVPALAASWGMKSLSWSVDTRDWQRPGVARILSNVDHQLRPGGVILMHDGGGDRSQTLAALKTLIPRLKEQGYKFDFPA